MALWELVKTSNYCSDMWTQKHIWDQIIQGLLDEDTEDLHETDLMLPKAVSMCQVSEAAGPCKGHMVTNLVTTRHLSWMWSQIQCFLILGPAGTKALCNMLTTCYHPVVFLKLQMTTQWVDFLPHLTLQTGPIRQTCTSSQASMASLCHGKLVKRGGSCHHVIAPDTTQH